MKLIGLTNDDIGGELVGFPGSLGNLGLIDTLTWEIGADGCGTLTATWTDGHPELRITAKGNLDKRGGMRECIFAMDARRRTHWGPRYISCVVDPNDAGVSGPREFIFRGYGESPCKAPGGVCRCGHFKAAA